jgi:antitoxin PrlF
MEKAAKVTSKGQVTIPREIRRFYHIHEGDTLVFEADGDTMRLRVRRPTEVFAKYEGIWREGEGLTLDEINAQIREMRGGDPDEFPESEP